MENPDGRSRKPKSLEAGMQISRSFDLEMRRRTLYEQFRRYLGEVFRNLAEQKQSRIDEGHLTRNQVRVLISLLPKYAVSYVVEYIKGKSATHLAQVHGEQKRNSLGQSFWARWYFILWFACNNCLLQLSSGKSDKKQWRSMRWHVWQSSCTQTKMG